MEFKEGKVIYKDGEYYQMTSNLIRNPRNANDIIRTNGYYLEHLIKIGDSPIKIHGKKYQKLCAMRSPNCKHKNNCPNNIAGVDWCNNIIMYYELI